MKRNIHLFIVSALLCQQLFAQQQYTQTVSAQNRECNVQCTIIDAPGFTYDPNALIFASPVLVNGVNPYPYIIGALYRTYQRKWSIFNLNGAAMVIGAQYKLEYYPADANHFVFIVPPRVHSNDDVYIDHAGLNDNPDAQIRIFPTNPQTGNAVFNVNEVRVTYVPSASKWIIANKAGGDVPAGVAYNIMFTSGSPSFTNDKAGKTLNTNPKTPVTTIPECNCVIPASLPPNGSAGGDLAGTFPYPLVTGLQGKPISNDPPSPGQVLKWNGSAWEPANENGTGGTTYNAGTGLAIQGSTIYANNIAAMWNANKLSGNSVMNTTPKTGDVLKWNGAAWEPGTDNVGATNQTSLVSKSSALFFNQSSMITLENSNINSSPILGIDNQVFTLAQSSRIVFHTEINVLTFESIKSIILPPPTDVWLVIDILNSSNVVVGSTTCESWFQLWVGQKMQSTGICVLPAGTYHTRISINREEGGSKLHVLGTFGPSHPSSVTNLIIEIFPD